MRWFYQNTMDSINPPSLYVRWFCRHFQTLDSCRIVQRKTWWYNERNQEQTPKMIGIVNLTTQYWQPFRSPLPSMWPIRSRYRYPSQPKPSRSQRWGDWRCDGEIWYEHKHKIGASWLECTTIRTSSNCTPTRWLPIMWWYRLYLCVVNADVWFL